MTSPITPQMLLLQRGKSFGSLRKRKLEKPPASQGIRIQDPTDPPVTRKPIDTTDMVVEAPLATKPPRHLVPTKQRTKSRYDPKHKVADVPEAVAEPAKVSKASKPKTTIAKPGQSYAQVGTKKLSE